MNNNVSFIVELTLTNGSSADLKKLMLELVESAEKNEPGTLAYEWTLNEDNTICHVHERYLDSDSALTHMATFNEKFAAKFMALGNMTGFVVYGNPSSALKDVLKGVGSTYMTPIGGFSR